MKYRIVESVEKKENINHPVDDNFTLSEELLDIKTEKINESKDAKEPTRDEINAVLNSLNCSEKEAIKRIKNMSDEDRKEMLSGYLETRKRNSYEESLEEDYEYSDYDKKLLVNRAKSIAKAISDLYNSNQVEAQGELPSVNEIAKALLDSPKKIDMYAKFLSKMKATKKAESLIEKLVKELMNFKKKLSMVKKPQPATESMNESVDELSEEEKKEIIDTLEDMIESGETSCECWDEPTKFLVKSELRKKGLKFDVSGNDRGNKFSYHFEWWNPKTESMDESLLVEKAVPEEDRYENDLIKSIIRKRKDRTNAKLTPEEQEVFNKYNLSIYPDKKQDRYWDNYRHRYVNGMITTDNKTKVGRRFISAKDTWAYGAKDGKNDVNYVDMARKAPERINRETETGIKGNYSQWGLGGSREEINHWYPNATQQLRNKINRDAQKDHRDLSTSIYYRNHHKDAMDTIDKRFDDEKNRILKRNLERVTKEIADNENGRNRNKEYSQTRYNDATAEINKILDKHRKNKQESFKRVSRRSINESEVSNKRNNNG